MPKFVRQHEDRSTLVLDDTALWKLLRSNNQVGAEPLFDFAHVLFAMLFATFPCVDTAKMVTVLHHVLGNPDAAASFKGTDFKKLTVSCFT